jgi:hypothetical protein
MVLRPQTRPAPICFPEKPGVDLLTPGGVAAFTR